VLTHRQVLYQLRYSVGRDRTATLRAIEAYAGRPTAFSKLPIAMQPQRWSTVGHGRQRRQQRGLNLLTGTGKTLGFVLQ
jgi:hypothetical protein